MKKLCNKSSNPKLAILQLIVRCLLYKYGRLGYIFLENILNVSFRLFGIIFQAISGSLLQLVLFLVVYFVRHWVHLHLAAGILSLLSIPSFLIISESPRCTVFQNYHFFVQKMKGELEFLHEQLK